MQGIETLRALLEQQMKISYLTRITNRVLGLTVLFFLPGIFVSVRRPLLLMQQAFSDSHQKLFSSNFFEFSDRGIMVTKSFWMFWAIMLPISIVIFGAVIIKTSSLWYLLRDCFSRLHSEKKTPRSRGVQKIGGRSKILLANPVNDV